jgi:hypothetical protein
MMFTITQRSIVQAMPFKPFALAILVFTFSGCAMKPEPQANQVSIAPDTLVTLPTAAQLGYSLTASQLITAQWAEKTHQLPVQLQVDSQKLALAGFSSWGSRILSLTYENQTIEASVLPGLGDTLPKPEQVLFNLMLTLWPLDAWHKPLEDVGWQLIETAQHRQLIDDEGMVVADINYQSPQHLDGDITFINHHLGYTITIKTLDYNQQ